MKLKIKKLSENEKFTITQKCEKYQEYQKYRSGKGGLENPLATWSTWSLIRLQTPYNTYPDPFPLLLI